MERRGICVVNIRKYFCNRVTRNFLTAYGRAEYASRRVLFSPVRCQWSPQTAFTDLNRTAGRGVYGDEVTLYTHPAETAHFRRFMPPAVARRGRETVVQHRWRQLQLLSVRVPRSLYTWDDLTPWQVFVSPHCTVSSDRPCT